MWNYRNRTWALTVCINKNKTMKKKKPKRKSSETTIFRLESQSFTSANKFFFCVVVIVLCLVIVFYFILFLPHIDLLVIPILQRFQSQLHLQFFDQIQASKQVLFSKCVFGIRTCEYVCRYSMQVPKSFKHSFTWTMPISIEFVHFILFFLFNL